VTGFMASLTSFGFRPCPRPGPPRPVSFASIDSWYSRESMGAIGELSHALPPFFGACCGTATSENFRAKTHATNDAAGRAGDRVRVAHLRSLAGACAGDAGPTARGLRIE
jgi:hypothetical protein